MEIRDALAQLEHVITAEQRLIPEDRTEALEQIRLLRQPTGSASGQLSQDQTTTAVEVLQGIFTVLPDTPDTGAGRKLVAEIANALIAPPSRVAGLIPIPPASLRFHITSAWTTIESFLETAELCKRAIFDSLARAGKHWDDVHSILDFGCGCGRTLRAFVKEAKEKTFYGTDIDAEAILWCNRYLPIGICSLNADVPPLRYAAEMFDLVYAFSVFTHIDEDYQLQWLEELKRVLRPGGVLVCSVHGSFVQETAGHLTPEQQAELHAHGFLYIKNMDMRGLLPEWYQTAFHTERYIRETFSRFFTVIAHLPQGLGNFQDLVILRKD